MGERVCSNSAIKLLYLAIKAGSSSIVSTGVGGTVLQHCAASLGFGLVVGKEFNTIERCQVEIRFLNDSSIEAKSLSYIDNRATRRVSALRGKVYAIN